MAGSADFKTELGHSDMFDQRLQAKIIKTVDVSYGGENGFNQAIELSAECLSNVKFIQEKKLIGKYFDEISQDTQKYCFGVDDTLKALEMGAVETLICWENLDIQVCQALFQLSFYIRFLASYFEKPRNWRGENLVLELCPREGQDSLHGSGHRS